MKIFHVTSSDSVDAIVKHGFKDATNFDGKAGVWFAVPAFARFGKDNDTVRMDSVVSVESPEDEIAEFEELPPTVPESFGLLDPQVLNNAR